MIENNIATENNNFEQQSLPINPKQNDFIDSDSRQVKRKSPLLLIIGGLLVVILAFAVEYIFFQNRSLPITQPIEPSADQAADTSFKDQSVSDLAQVADELIGFEEKLSHFDPEKSMGQFTWQNFTGTVTSDGKLIYEPAMLSGIVYTMYTARNAGINSQSDITSFLEDRSFYPSNANWDGMNLLGFQKDKIVCLFLSDEYGSELSSSENITETLSCGYLPEFIQIEFDTAAELIDHLKIIFENVDGEFKDQSGFSYYSLVDDQEKTVSGVGFTIEGQNGVELANYLQINGYLNQSWGAFDGPLSSGIGCGNGKISCQITTIFSSSEDHLGATMTGDQIDQTSISCTDEVIQ